MEVNSSDRSIVLLKAVYQGAHAVVPQLDGGGMQGNKNPWSLGVKGNALCAGGLGLELGEHRGVGSHGGLWRGSLSSVHVLVPPNAQAQRFDEVKMEGRGGLVVVVIVRPGC